MDSPNKMVEDALVNITGEPRSYIQYVMSDEWEPKECFIYATHLESNMTFKKGDS